MLGGVAAWGDYDLDGDDDLLLVGEIFEDSSPSRIARIYDNTGAGFSYNTVASEELVGVYRGDAAWGDYDSDGYPDLALVGWNPEDEETLLLYHNTNDVGERHLSSDQQQLRLTGSRYARLAWADYDGDGDLDLIVSGMEATGNSQTRLYHNTGGFFREDDVNSAVVIGVHNGDIAWADYDNDGDYDLSVSGDNVTYAGGGIVPEIKFYKNDPVGSLALDRALSDPIEDSSAGVRRGALAWGDYDGDGAVDLAVSGRLWNSETSLTIYRNRPAGELAPDTNFRLRVDQRVDGGLEFLDYDNDGDVDLAAVGRTNLSDYVASVFPNESGELFENSNESNLEGLSGGSATWSDYDLDGRADLLLTGIDVDGARRTILYHNRGSFASNNRPNAPTLFYAPEVTSHYVTFRWGPGSDADNDNFTYNLRVGSEPGSSDIYSSAIGSDVGNTGFKTNKTLFRSMPIDTYYWSVQCIDGGAAASEWSQEQILNVRRFVSSQQSLRPLKESAMDWGDNDGDGDIDLILTGLDRSGNAQSIAYVNNEGTLELDPESNRALLPLRNGDVALGDYDNDGRLDVLVTGEDSYENAGTYLYRNGPLGLSQVVEFPPVSYSSAEWGDYDNDGDLDLVLMGKDPSEQFRTGVFANDGEGVFVRQDSLIGLANGEVLWGDLDQDGDVDIVASGSSSDGVPVFRSYRNDVGSLEIIDQDVVGVESSDLAWSDFDGDGDLDLAIGGISGRGDLLTEILVKSGEGGLSHLDGPIFPGIRGGDLVWGDFDNDRDQDLIISGNDGRKPILRAYENTLGRTDAEQSFVLEPVDSTVVTFLDFSAVALVDVDQDGDLDLITSGSEGGVSAIPRTIVNDNMTGLFNPNLEPTVPMGLSSADEADTVVLSWLAADDDGDDTPGSISYNVRVGTDDGVNDILSGSGRLRFGNSGHTLNHRLTGLLSGGYHWAVQSVDDGYATSAWSSVSEFTIDTIKPVVASVLPSRVDTVGVGQAVAVVIEMSDEHTAIRSDIPMYVVAELADTAIVLSPLKWNGVTWNSQIVVKDDFPSGIVRLRIAGATDGKGNQMEAHITDGLFSVDTELPRMIAGEPRPGAEDIAADASTITVTFSEPLDPTTVNSESFSLRRGTETLPLLTEPTTDESATRVLLVPEDVLRPGSEYVVEISASIRDKAGNRPSDAIVWSFKTTIPTLDVRVPAANASIAAENIDKISAQFNADVDRLYLANNVSEAISITREDDIVELLEAPVVDRNNTLSFVVEGGMLPGSRYRVQLDGNLAGPLRAAESGDFVWDFQTVVPELSATIPEENSNAKSYIIEAVFDSHIDRAMLQDTGSIKVLRGGVEQAISNVKYDADAKTLRFELEGGLKPGAYYQVSLSGVFGGPLRVLSEGNYEWQFSTPVPQLSSSVPVDGAEDVDASLSAILAEFDSPVDVETLLQPESVQLLAAGAPVGLVGLEFVQETRTLRFEAGDGLGPGTNYEVRIAAGIGGTQRAGDYVWQFGTPVPQLVSTMPKDGDTEIRIDQDQIEATFDYAIAGDALLRADNVQLLASGVPVALSGLIYDSGNNTARFEPEGGLRAGTPYEVRVAATVGGPRREGDYVWEFSTPVPQLFSTTPVAGDLKADKSKSTIEATFDHGINAEMLLLPDNVRLLAAGAPVTIEGFDYNSDTRTMRFEPVGGLRAGTPYEARITSMAGGPKRGGDYTWEFSTPVPDLHSTEPVAGDAGVDIYSSAIVAVFDRGVNDDVLLQPGNVRLLAAGNPLRLEGLEYNGNTRTLRFSPEGGLRAGTPYEVRINAAVGGPQRLNGYGWEFSTAVPLLITSEPNNNAVDISPSIREFSAVFSASVDEEQLTSEIFRISRQGVELTLRPGDPVHRGDYKYAFAPAEGWMVGSRYSVNIASIVSGPLGAGVDNSMVFDTDVPELTKVSPNASDTTITELEQGVSAIFDAPIDQNVLLANDGIQLYASNVPVEISPPAYDPESGRVSFEVPAGLRPGTAYNVRIHPQVGGPLQEDPSAYDWAFSTRIPTVVSLSPSLGSAISSGTSRLTATFSGPVDPLLINSSNFRVSELGTPFVLPADEFAFDMESYRVSFPSVNLVSGTSYQAFVSARTGGPLAEGAGVRDTSWTFTTKIPIVNSLSPADTEEGVSLNDPTIQISFTEPVARQIAEDFRVTTRELGVDNQSDAIVAITGFGADESGKIVSFAPVGGLRPFAEYVVTVAKEALGSLAERGFNWSFSTSALLADSRKGGTIRNGDGSVLVEFPPNALPAGSNQIAIRRLDLPGAGKPTVGGDPAQMTSIYEIDAGVDALNKPTTLAFRYEDERSNVLERHPLSIYRYAAGLWIRVGGVEDPEVGVIRTVVDDLGRFAVFEDLSIGRQKAKIDQLDCQPRAFDPTGQVMKAQTDISFALTAPADVSIRVFNSAGRMVRVVDRQRPLSAGRSVVVWDGQDDSGKIVPSGPYVVSVQVRGQRVDKVVAIIR